MISRFLAGALLSAIPAGASAQLQPSEPEAVAEAVVDCWTAVEAGAVNESALAARGWRAGSIADAKGGKVETSLRIFGKANVMLTLDQAGKSPVCSVMSRVGSAAAVSSVAQAVQRRLTAADPQVKTARSGNSIVFLALPKIAMLDRTGTKDRPAVRIAVQHQGAERG